mgnify:CR=1 FL=1
MAWDKDVPGTGIIANALDNLVRGNNAALDDSLGCSTEIWIM